MHQGTTNEAGEQVVTAIPAPERLYPNAIAGIDATYGIDALDVLLALARRKTLIAIVSLIALLLGIVTAFFILSPTYTSGALILPPPQQSSTAALLSQLGSISSLSGGAALGLKTPADMYVGILQSRTIADNIIAAFHLQSEYKRKTLQDARISLKKQSTIDVGKDGLIEISVIDHDPQRASDITNAYVDELYRMNAKLAITEAAQRRLFFEQQLDAEREALASAEEELRTTQQKTGIIQITGQAQMIIESIAQLRAQISSRQVELKSLRSFATDQNPDVVRLQGEISTMQAQLTKMQNDQQRQEQPGDISVPAGNVPEASLEYARKLREVKYHESLFDLLSKQHEAARIDEAKSAPIIQIVDRAVPSDKRSGPPRLLIMIGFAVMGFLLASGFALAEFALERMRRVPHQRAKLESLRSQLSRSRVGQ